MNPFTHFAIGPQLREFALRGLAGDYPFMICSLPGSGSWLCFAPDGVATPEGVCRGDFASVVISGFDGGEWPLDAPAAEPLPELYPTTPRQIHAQTVRRVAARLGRDGGKTVISRVISGTAADPLGAIGRYFATFPATFRFLYSSPAAGVWFGASPELLLDNNTCSGVARTMALAGTRPSTSETVEWDHKNIHEHELVVDFIMSTLASCGMNPRRGESGSRGFGAIEHRFTPIEADAALDPLAAIRALSPTPALAGFPRPTALDEISRSEPYRRLCYGGYISLEPEPGHRVAYVNLRSARLKRSAQTWGYNIYVGGGITADSDPDAEWTETEMKSECLARCLES